MSTQNQTPRGADHDYAELDEDLFVRPTPQVTPTDVSRPETPAPEKQMIGSADLDLTDADTETTDKEPTKEFHFEYTNPRFTNAQWPFKTADLSKPPFTHYRPLAIINHTPTEAVALTEHPYYDRADASFDDRFLDAMVRSQEESLVDNMFADSTKREGADWGTKVPYEGQMLGHGRPVSKPRNDGDRIVGVKAIGKVQEILGLGAMVKVPLWHSGFWVSLKTPDDIALLNFYETINREKINLGKSTAGLVFANGSSFINAALYDLISDCIYETSIKDCKIADLKDVIKMNDLAVLAWALAYVLYPNGYSYTRPCMVNPDVCQHVTEALLDVGKLLWVDRSALSEKQRKHMSLIPRRQRELEEVRAYQDEFEDNRFKEYTYNDAITIVFRQPTLAEHLASGGKWIEELEGIVRDVFTEDLKNDELNRYINQRANVTKLRNYSHYIKHIAYLGDNTVSDDADSIERVLNQISSVPEVVEGLVDALNLFIDNSAVAMVGIPRVPCSNCNQMDEEEAKANPWIIPLNPVRLFFRLRDRRLQQSIQN